MEKPERPLLLDSSTTSGRPKNRWEFGQMLCEAAPRLTRAKDDYGRAFKSYLAVLSVGNVPPAVRLMRLLERQVADFAAPTQELQACLRGGTREDRSGELSDLILTRIISIQPSLEVLLGELDGKAPRLHARNNGGNSALVAWDAFVAKSHSIVSGLIEWIGVVCATPVPHESEEHARDRLQVANTTGDLYTLQGRWLEFRNEITQLPAPLESLVAIIRLVRDDSWDANFNQQLGDLRQTLNKSLVDQNDDVATRLKESSIRLQWIWNVLVIFANDLNDRILTAVTEVKQHSRDADATRSLPVLLLFLDRLVDLITLFERIANWEWPVTSHASVLEATSHHSPPMPTTLTEVSVTPLPRPDLAETRYTLLASITELRGMGH